MCSSLYQEFCNFAGRNVVIGHLQFSSVSRPNLQGVSVVKAALAAQFVVPMVKPRIFSLPFVGSIDIGQLVVAEGINLPFSIKRVYWTFGVPSDKIRGHHAHYTLEQLIIAVHGTIELAIETPDRERHLFILDHPSKAVYIPQLCWREIKFSPDTVLLCLASQEYVESDYIRSYYDYLRLVEGESKLGC